MKYIFITFFIFILASKNALGIESFIIVKVENSIITNVDIENEANYLMLINDNVKNLQKDKILNFAKKSLIREKIKENEINKTYQDNSESEYLNDIIKNFYQRFGLNNEKELSLFLKNRDLSIKEIRKKLDIETKWNGLIYNRYFNQLEINEKIIKQKVKNQIKEKSSLRIYNLSELLFNAQGKSKVEEKYNIIKKNIDSSNFENAVATHSQADSAQNLGDIGWVKENELSKKIQDTLIKLKVNEYTGPIIVPGGILILNINDMKIEKISINEEELYKKMIQYEKNRQLNNFSKIYFNKIKKNTPISE